eukprot:scaffold24238_cov72-Phaeocystis_antarctica.AAC.2
MARLHAYDDITKGSCRVLRKAEAVRKAVCGKKVEVKVVKQAKACIDDSRRKWRTPSGCDHLERGAARSALGCRVATLAPGWSGPLKPGWSVVPPPPVSSNTLGALGRLWPPPTEGAERISTGLPSPSGGAGRASLLSEGVPSSA